MMTIQKMSPTACNDAELVTESLSGNRNAFRQIVAHYQSLICSLAYSATGSLTQSEDIAQDTFVTAWKKLPELREPAKLRAWLCGIARNLIGKTLRQERRDPTHAAEQLDQADDFPSQEPLPPDQAISKEEEGILWRSLERIPEIYREPLVLFYREHQSIEYVAEALDLTPDAVKQRLSRGRKLLHEQVLAFVEGALRQTGPGSAFTLGVLAALPAMTRSANASLIGVTTAKGGALVKSAGLAGFFSTILGPVLMFFSLYFGYRVDREDTGSSQRCEFISKYYRILVTCILIITAAILSLTLGARSLLNDRPKLYMGLVVGLGMSSLIMVAALAVWMSRSLRNIRQQEVMDTRPTPIPAPMFEYLSKHRIFGLPLVHIRLRGGLERGPVKAWIAGGDAAIGGIFAFGALAIAPFSVGGVALGLMTVGGFTIGLAPFGGFSVGPWAIGGMAIGWQAYGGCAIAWLAAQGAVAVSHAFALGIVALGRHANDPAAQAFIANSSFFRSVQEAMRYAGWLNLMWLFPFVLWLCPRKNRCNSKAPDIQ